MVRLDPRKLFKDLSVLFFDIRSVWSSGNAEPLCFQLLILDNTLLQESNKYF